VILGEGVEAGEPTDNAAGPRFRSGSSDWADEGEDAFAALAAQPDDEDVTLASLASAPEDDDVAFDREVAARRVRSAPAARPRAPRPARSGEELDLGPDRPDTLVRVVTGLGIAALALLCLSAGAAATMVLATAIVGVCAFEFFQALHQRGFRPATVIGLLGTVTIVPLAYHRGEFAFPFTLALVMVFSLLWFVFEVVHTRPMVNVAVTVGGFVYTGVLGAFAGLLLTSENGVGLILGVAIPVIAYDIAGFFIGSQFGKTRLAPEISPNKTVEGLIGGMAGSIVVAVLIVKQIHPWGDLLHVFALGVTVAIMAPLGDLAESMLKRDLGIKDFGALLPGHGGVLDRFDAILFCLPAVYFLARALKIG
jgi:phosphatidate cytidylyltransferase